MRIVAVIPARWGSTRFPGKPLHSIAGKPLVQHVWERACRAKKIDEIIVATDDMRIAESAFQFGAEVALTSPDHPSGTDRIAEVIGKAKQVTHVINLQGDEPALDPKLIDKLAGELIKDRKLEMITAASAFDREEDFLDPNQVKVVLSGERNALYFSRSPIPFRRGEIKLQQTYRHIGIYGYSRKLLMQFVKWKPTFLEQTEKLEQLRALEHGVKIRVVLTKASSPGVDTPEDVARVEGLL